jgi:1,4-dihydroxy-2-naphthoate polyprenyltransferase
MSKNTKQNKSRKRAKLWVAGARLRTLPLAIAPVLLGACMPMAYHTFSVVLEILALVVAIMLQIGVNYANDYSDGIRGTDAHRVGPVRLVGSGSIKAAEVKRAAFIAFAVAALAGLGIVLITHLWWLIAVGISAILAAWFYTGGKRPYGYAGLGDVMVFIFFGLVATVGTSYIQQGYVDQTEVLLGAAAGFFACAVLMVNNLRDRVTDQHVGKKTLSVRVGPTWSKVIFLLDLWSPFAIISLIGTVFHPALLGWAAVFLAAPATIIFLAAKSPKELILVLKLTSYAALLFAVIEFLVL